MGLEDTNKNEVRRVFSWQQTLGLTLNHHWFTLKKHY